MSFDEDMRPTYEPYMLDDEEMEEGSPAKNRRTDAAPAEQANGSAAASDVFSYRSGQLTPYHTNSEAQNQR